MSFVKNVRVALRDRAITQAKLAKAIGVCQATLSTYLSKDDLDSNIELRDALAIAKALGIPITELLSDDEPTRPVTEIPIDRELKRIVWTATGTPPKGVPLIVTEKDDDKKPKLFYPVYYEVNPLTGEYGFMLHNVFASERPFVIITHEVVAWMQIPEPYDPEQ